MLSSPLEELQKHIENVSPPVKSFKQVHLYLHNQYSSIWSKVGWLNVWTCVSFLATPPYSAVVENTFCTNPLRCLTDRQPSNGFSRQRKRQQQIQFAFPIKLTLMTNSLVLFWHVGAPPTFCEKILYQIIKKVNIWDFNNWTKYQPWFTGDAIFLPHLIIGAPNIINHMNYYNYHYYDLYY